jgi:hypothetical protein
LFGSSQLASQLNCLLVLGGKFFRKLVVSSTL